MARPGAAAVLLLALACLCSGAHGIQNDRTRSQQRGNPTDVSVSGAGSLHTRTSEELFRHNAASENLERTREHEHALRLESSKSLGLDDLELEMMETRYATRLNDALSTTSTAYLGDDLAEELTSSKLYDQIDGNQIEVKPGDYYRNIVPTRSENLSGEGQGAPQEPRQDGPSSEPREQQVRASQVWPRQARREQPARIFSEHAPLPQQQPKLHSQPPGTGQRQANPDIQDIITGIVKLLNGKVNVAVNSAKPVRPVQSTRINNRGPPRISDLPPLPPDFDTPGMNPPPLPPPDLPATYELPPAPSAPSINQLPPELPMGPFVSGIPIPDAIMPQPGRPSWNRPLGRPSIGGTRRPIPPYKPLPPANTTFIPEQHQHHQHQQHHQQHHQQQQQQHQLLQQATDADKQNGVLEAQHGLGNKIDHEENRTRLTDAKGSAASDHATAAPPPRLAPTRKYQSTLRTDHNAIAENTLVLGGLPPQPLPIPSASDNETAEPPKPVVPLKSSDDYASAASQQLNEKKESSSSTSTKAVIQTTLNVETSSSVQVIETTHTTTMLEPSIASVMHSDYSESPTIEPSTSTIVPSVLNLEPSQSSSVSVDLSSSLSTPTEGLTTNPLRETHTTQTSTAHQPITSSVTFSKAQSSVYSYRPRPGIVLDDTLDYAGNGGIITQRPYVPPRHPTNADTFDVVVSAIQGPGGSGTGEVRVPVNGGHGGDDILTSPVEGQGFVSIDGKRTYLNLFDNTESTPAPSKVQVQPTRTQGVPIGTGFAVPQTETTGISPRPSVPVRRPTFHRRPTQPPVRIDTCIVGDSSTCDASQHEACATVQGVSACHCKPGFARLIHSLPCKKIVSIVVSIRVDKIYDRKIVWTKDLGDKDSEFYQTLAYEANRAIESAMSMTPFSDEYVGSLINNVYQGDVSQGQGGVFVNATLKLAYEPRTARQSLAGELQKHLLGVIQRRYNNIGNSALHVESPAGSISNLQDLDECASSELNDCHSSASCTNTWGGFICSCNAGLKDPHKSDTSTAGRVCLSCPNSHCNNRGTCSYQGDQMQCTCTGNYYGAQCEVDGEVLGVAIGASVAALIIIVLTLVCLVMWSRRWSREQKAISPVYGYVQGGLPGTLPARVGSVGTLASVKQGPPTNLPPYMWAQVADHLATANVYATEPMGPTRPSSAMFGYPTLSLHGTLPPVPLPRLQAPPRARQRHHQPEPDSSDSEPQDKDRADLIPQSNSNFQVPRPKSRSSLANQSGIYYDVEYDQGDARHLSKNNIPMSTYSMAPYYRT